MKNKILMVLMILLLCSCGVFLEKSVVKNFTPKEKITQKGLNKYQYDFLYLTNLVEEAYPKLDSTFPKQERQRQRKYILSKLTNADNNIDFVLHTRKYLSNLKNQHTNISLKQDFKRVYPFLIYISSDEWYLLTLSTRYDSIHIGKKIKEINGISTSEIEKRLIDYTFAENKINQQFEVRDLQLYNKPEYLREIGVIKENVETVKLSFEDHSEIVVSPKSTEHGVDVYDISFEKNPITTYKNETYFYTISKEQNFGYLQFNRCHDQVDISLAMASYVKPWLQPIARGYVKRQFKKDKPSKQMAKYYNPIHPIFKDFVWELIDSLNTSHIDNLIIDLRNNPGGNLTLGIQLMYFLTEQKNLKGFAEYAFTSDIYKNYFLSEYKDLQKNYPEGVLQRELVQMSSGKNLFRVITDEKSKYFVEANRPVFEGNVFIFSNYKTGSAAAILTTLLQDNGIGTIIGTSVGNNPIGATTYTPMESPKTKANISIATTYIERPLMENGVVQIPDIWIEYALSDLKNGKDPYLDTAVHLFGMKTSH